MFSVRGGVELDHISAIPEYGIDVSSRVSTVGLQFLCRHRCLLIKEMLRHSLESAAFPNSFASDGTYDSEP